MLKVTVLVKLLLYCHLFIRRYDKEFAEYQNTDQYKTYLESQKEKESAPAASSNGESKSKKKKKAVAASVTTAPVVTAVPVLEVKETREERNSFEDSEGELSVAEPQHRENSNSFDIPIFTEEFLDHNKARELELKEREREVQELANAEAMRQAKYETDNAKRMKEVEEDKARLVREEKVEAARKIKATEDE